MAQYTGTDEGESIGGGDEDDLLQGLGGDDVLDGAGGIDVLEGGLGDDRYVVGETRRTVDGIDGYWADQTVEDVDAGTDTVVWMGLGGYRLADNIENGVAGTRYGGGIIGNELDNVITGWDGTNDGNWLDGGGGNDTITGGDWDDDLKGGDGADVLIGYAGENTLDYTLDSDTLDGGAGADVMEGGDGYDTYWADDVGDQIIEVARPAGADDTEAYYFSYDTVYWTGQGNYVLPFEVDIMHLRGGATTATGNDASNVIIADYGGYTQFGELIGDGDVTVDGAGGDDFMFGGSGADMLLGGDGSDQVDGMDGNDTLHGGAGDDTIHGDSNQLFSVSDDTLFGDAGDDRLEGDNGDDVLDGGAGGDVLIGSFGDDVMTGGAGVDRFSLDQDDDVATDFTDGEDLILGDFGRVTVTQDGADTVIAFQGDLDWDRGTLRLLGVDAATITADDFVRYTEGSEYNDDLGGGGGDDYVSGGDGDDVIGVGGGDDGGDGGAGDDRMSGGRGADELRGGTGDDVIDGGSGADQMSGGAGDDRFIVDDAGDRAVDTGGGIDTEVASISAQLGRGVENLVLSGGRGASAARLDAAPARGLVGTGNALDNGMTGSHGNDHLLGRGGDDRLAGGAGDDRLDGGVGNDRLTGGVGADTFVVGDRGGRDVIADFREAQHDRIEIHSGAAHRFADLTIAETRGGDAVVSWQGGSITLAGVDAATLDRGDFRFVGAGALSAVTADAGWPGWGHPSPLGPELHAAIV